MPTPTSAPSHTCAHKVPTATFARYGRFTFPNKIAFSVVLFALAMSALAQAQQVLPENAAGGADAETSNLAKKPAAADQSQSAAGLSKEIANPLSNLWLLQIQQNNTFMDVPLGKGTYVQSNLQFQPLVPIPLSAHWNWISRPVIPVFSSQPYPVVTSAGGAAHINRADINRTTSLGDMIFATAISPDSSLVGNWLVAAGATFVLPTATQHVLGQNVWQAGPTVALGYKGSKWLAFVFPQHWWKVGGDGKKTNQTLVQYNFSWNFDSGWSVGTSPNLTVNWEAPAGQRLSFPLGLQVGKLLHAGPMPVKVDLQAMYYPVRPSHTYGAVVPSPKWGFQLQFTPVIPSLIHGHKL